MIAYVTTHTTHISIAFTKVHIAQKFLHNNLHAENKEYLSGGRKGYVCHLGCINKYVLGTWANVYACALVFYNGLEYIN